MSIGSLRLLVGNAVTEYGSLRLADLQFWHRPEARLALIGLSALSLVCSSPVR